MFNLTSLNHVNKKPRFNLSCFANHKKFFIADIGGNLNIESLQDMSTYNSKQESASASGTFGIGNSQASASLSQSKINKLKGSASN